MRRVAESSLPPLERIARIVNRLEKRIYRCSCFQTEKLAGLIAKAAKEIDKISGESDEAKIPDRKSPDFLPPRDDMKVRFKKKDIRKEDKSDYRDTLFDKDLEE